MATETKKMKDRDKVIYLVCFAAIVVALYFLLRKHGASATLSSPTQNAGLSGEANPSPQPSLYWPPTSLTIPAIPASSINVNWSPANNQNQPTGYVPLYGFIGYGGQWF